MDRPTLIPDLLTADQSSMAREPIQLFKLIANPITQIRTLVRLDDRVIATVWRRANRG
jgi:hypothetical protein